MRNWRFGTRAATHSGPKLASTGCEGVVVSFATLLVSRMLLHTAVGVAVGVALTAEVVLVIVNEIETLVVRVTRIIHRRALRTRARLRSLELIRRLEWMTRQQLLSTRP